MNKSFHSQLVALALFASPIVAQSATYYVDYDGGNNASAGTSTGTAWKHCPGDTNATGTAASTSLVAGDTVKFKGGVRYIGQPLLNWSGSLAEKITYDGNSAGDWGAGNATIACADITRQYIAFYTPSTARSNIVWKNLTFNMPASNAVGRTAIYTATGSQDLLILSCLFSNIGFASNIVGAVAGDINSTAVYLPNNRRVYITDCEFTRMFRGIQFRGDSATVHSTDTTVTNCVFHDYMVWLIDHATAAVGAGVTNSLVINSVFRDYDQFNSGCWAGTGEKPHADGIYYRADGAGGTSFWGNLVIQGCWFTNSSGSSCAGGTASIFIVGGPSVTIRSNVFWNDNQSDASISIDHQLTAGGTQTVAIHNNTFKGAIRSLLVSAWTPATQRHVTIRDNIFYIDNLSGSAVWCNIENVTNIAQCNYNLYYDTGGSDLAYIQPGGYQTLALMRTWNNLELNGAQADPLLDGSFRLSASSPAIAMASDGGDVGAFPYSSGGGSGNGPTNIAARFFKLKGLRIR